MTRAIHNHRKLAVILLLLCVTILGQLSALSSQSESHHATDHCCLLCHVGPLPMLQNKVSAVVAPVFQVAWLARSQRLETTSDVLLIPSPSRAPPAV